jgi:hypothetical protein
MGRTPGGASQQRFAIAGTLCILGALLTPSCCFGVPQLLSALGILSVGIRCLFWLERLRPLFASVAIVSLAYEAWEIFCRPASSRTTLMKSFFAASVISSVAVMGVWVYLDIRYQ